MDTKKLVKLSNIIGLVSIVLLGYWVFAFILIQVFGLKVFRQHLTETFGFSILGIISLMAGALMLNIMLNLTRIAERGEGGSEIRSGKKLLYMLLLVFPLLAAVLFGGNYLTAQKKQQILIQSAEKLVKQHPAQTQAMADYRFELPYIQNTANYLNLMEKQDTAFKSVAVIVPDTINGTPVYLGFGSRPLEDFSEAVNAASATDKQPQDTLVYKRVDDRQEIIRKADYLHSADLREREYLQKTFQNNSNEIEFVAQEGNYELFYPYQKNGKTVAVFLFSDYQRYGKFGSY